jgi:hypothetical protein
VKTNLASSREELIYVDFASSLAIPGMLILLQKVALLSETPQERLLEIVVAPDRRKKQKILGSHDPLRASNIPTADPTRTLHRVETFKWTQPILGHSVVCKTSRIYGLILIPGVSWH